MSQRVEKGILIAILVIFVVLGTAYSIVVPPFEASDELWHYPMVKYIADHWSLPVQDPANIGPWRQEGSQPPLYYALSAVATSWIDTSDMAEVRHLNPHVDNGIATPDGNANLVVHRPGRETFPWRGTVLAIHVVRFLSVLMAVAGVALTYFVVREVVPTRPGLALGATAIHAFTPMVVFIAGSVNNDNLGVPLGSLHLLMRLRLLPPAGRPPRASLPQTARRYLLLGIVLGLAALTKTSSLALTVLTALVVTVRALARGSENRADGWRAFIIGGMTTLLPFLAISGWWYLRNVRLYGDPSGLNAFIQILGKREIEAGLGQLWRERHSFLAGYWGNFGGLNVPMSPWVYRVLNACLVLAGLGLVLSLGRVLARSLSQSEDGPERRELGTRATSLVFGRSRSTRDAAAWSRSLPLAVCLLWGLGILIPWAQWARVTWSSQGRLIFTALPVWSLLLTLGLRAWLPPRFNLGPGGEVPPLVLLLALFLLALSVIAPSVWIRPAYALPEPLSDAESRAIPRRSDVSFDNAMRLLGYDLKHQQTRAGGQVAVTLYWEALAPTAQDHTVFVHLLDKHELVIAQRDTFPGLGLLSTTWLEPGYRWADHYVIPIPATAYAPNEAEVEVGVYKSRTGQRLEAIDESGEPQGDNLRFGQVTIKPQRGTTESSADVPNPIAINFGDRMLLSGYDLSQRAVQAGETMTLTLHWTALRGMDRNYTVSTQVIDASQRKAAQHDSWPLDGAAPTEAWEPGQRLTDTVSLPISPDGVAGSYDVRIAVYWQEEGEIRHLPVTPPGGRMQASHITLTNVRVMP